jgi:hypothetical protein
MSQDAGVNLDRRLVDSGRSSFQGIQEGLSQKALAHHGLSHLPDPMHRVKPPCSVTFFFEVPREFRTMLHPGVHAGPQLHVSSVRHPHLRWTQDV